MAPDLAPYIGGIYRYDFARRTELPDRVALLPGCAHLLFSSRDRIGFRAHIAERDWIEPKPVFLLGPSSTLIMSEGNAGALIGAVIRPRGWLRFLDQSAKDWANRIDEPRFVSGFDLEAAREQLFSLENEELAPAVFEGILGAALRPAQAEGVAVGRIEAALMNQHCSTVAELAGAAGLSVRSLERLANRAFGFGPKLLLRRARFLRSLGAIAVSAPSERAKVIDPAYTDYSHFVRDSHHFLGMPPQSFLRMGLPILGDEPGTPECSPVRTQVREVS